MKDLKKFQRDPKKNKVSITLRISPEASAFMKKEKLSPTLIFATAIEDLMKQ